MRQAGWVARIPLWLTELCMLQCAFTGVLDAVAGLEAFVFVTAVDFTSTSLVEHQPAIYVIVEMEEVRKKRKTRQMRKQANLLKLSLQK